MWVGGRKGNRGLWLLLFGLGMCNILGWMMRCWKMRDKYKRRDGTVLSKQGLEFFGNLMRNVLCYFFVIGYVNI